MSWHLQPAKSIASAGEDAAVQVEETPPAEIETSTSRLEFFATAASKFL